MILLELYIIMSKRKQFHLNKTLLYIVYRNNKGMEDRLNFDSIHIQIITIYWNTSSVGFFHLPTCTHMY